MNFMGKCEQNVATYYDIIWQTAATHYNMWQHVLTRTNYGKMWDNLWALPRKPRWSRPRPEAGDILRASKMNTCMHTLKQIQYYNLPYVVYVVMQIPY